MLHRFVVLCFMAVLACSAGCAGSASSGGGAAPATASGDTSQCVDVYAYAPSAYIIHIVSGDAVILDPLSNDFPVFCDPQSAGKALRAELDAGRLPGSNWKIFRVYGKWSEVATEVSPGAFLLNRPAPLVDWVD